MNEVIRNLVRDLCEAGVDARRRAVLALLYDHALTASSARAWTRLYRALFSALRLVAHKRLVRSRASRLAVESLLRLLEDDLGSSLFGTGATGRLRASLERPLYFQPLVTTGLIAPVANPA
jgi:hypothetical protein